MKNYTITVNGNVYDVTVEEGAQGAVKVNAPMPGKILKVNATAGAAVKKGDVLVVLEAMKMENEICAPQDGTIATVECAAGDSVESGKVLVSLN